MNTTNHSVHLVDDDDIALMVMHDILRVKYRISFSKDLGSATKYLHENDLPAVVILDMLFATGSGEEFIDYLRSNTRLCNVPVIMCSSISPADSYLSKNVYHLPKPIISKQLLDLVEFIV